MLEESKSGPCYCGKYSGGANQEEQQSHFLQSDRMISGIALSEKWMGIRIVPYRPRSVEVLTSNGEVNDLNDAMREEEEGDRIGREIIDVGTLDYQIHRAQTELQ